MTTRVEPIAEQVKSLPVSEREELLSWLAEFELGQTDAWDAELAMSVDIQIETLSVAEKVRLLESVWESLSARPCDVRSPEWHHEVVGERRRHLEDGRATISAWPDAKARLMQLGR